MLIYILHNLKLVQETRSRDLSASIRKIPAFAGMTGVAVLRQHESYNPYQRRNGILRTVPDNF